MPRKRPCDCCMAPRLKWQRLCDSCYRTLPGSLRTGLIDAWRRKDTAAWRSFRRRCREFMTDRAHAHVRACIHPVTPERAYALTAAITGEKE